MHGGSDVTGYKVQVWDSATSSWVDEASPTGTSYTHRELTPGKTYYYKVAAVNSQGTGPYGPTTPLPYLAIKTGIDAVALPNLVATAVGPNEIRLTWNVPAANGSTHTGYMLQKWDGSTWEGLGNLLGTDDNVRNRS